MSGPRPAGKKWTRAEDDQLRTLLKAGKSVVAIARTLKRTQGAIYSRVRYLDKNEKAAEA